MFKCTDLFVFPLQMQIYLYMRPDQALGWIFVHIAVLIRSCSLYSLQGSTLTRGHQTGKVPLQTTGAWRNHTYTHKKNFSHIYIWKFLASSLSESTCLVKLGITLRGEMAISVQNNNKYPFLSIGFFLKILRKKVIIFTYFWLKKKTKQ